MLSSVTEPTAYEDEHTRTRTHARTHKNKETVVSARKLLQYFQLPDKNSRDILTYVYNFCRHFKIVVCLFHYFSRKPKCCSVEPSLRNSALGQRCH
jgi:hypothetical protein